MSYGLTQAGLGMKSDAHRGLKEVAQMEEQRNQHNESVKQQQKQSKISGAASGAMMGTMIMPGLGTVVGGALGYILS